MLREHYERGTEGDRSNAAVKRLNAIHGMYEKEISNADMLFTLAQFVTAPATWIDRSVGLSVESVVRANRQRIVPFWLRCRVVLWNSAKRSSMLTDERTPDVRCRARPLPREPHVGPRMSLPTGAGRRLLR